MRIRVFIVVLALLAFQQSFGQSKVSIDRYTQRFLGDVSELDRTKFFNSHSGSDDSWETDFRKDYNVGKGRGFWGAWCCRKTKNKRGSGVSCLQECR